MVQFADTIHNFFWVMIKFSAINSILAGCNYAIRGKNQDIVAQHSPEWLPTKANIISISLWNSISTAMWVKFPCYVYMF